MPPYAMLILHKDSNVRWAVFVEKNNCVIATRISITYRIIEAIGEHVISQNALAGGDEGIGIEEAGEGGVVVAGLEVVKPRFLVVDIASIAEGVMGAEGGGQGAGGG